MGNKMMEDNSPSRFFKAINSIATLVILWLLIILLLSLFELIYNASVHHFRLNFGQALVWAWLNDLIFWFKTLPFIYPVLVVLFILLPKFTRVICYVLLAAAVLLQFGLSLYFATTLVPLGGDVYSYSTAEIRQTVGASGVVKTWNIIIVVIVAGVTVAALWLVQRKIKLNRYIVIALPVITFVILITGGSEQITGPNLKTEFANNLILNKPDYFWKSSMAHFYPEENERDIYADNYITDNSETGKKSADFKYTDPQNYPFLHGDTVADVLSPFFNSSPTPPNIVIVIVEGLGRAFTNDGGYLGNFTPFIDSLSGKSLYWKNFLSEGGRTFAALPSILGSLPFAKNGFLELGDSMPNHLSLLSLAKFNGYHTSFYYGGDAHFDNMDVFLRKNHVDELNDQKSFPAGFVRLPAPNGFSWGYNDKSLFKHYLDSRAVKTAAPQLSVILTVSTHSPFAINEEDKYLKQFEQRMDQLNFTDLQKEEHRDYKLQYASVLYLDDALRSFFNSYGKRNDYNHTIFLITGDHRMPEIPMSDKIDRYHVPLIIYSPMLKRPVKIASVSTHFDISPSLLAYLHHHYKTKGPSLVSWMGQGLDTNHNFRNLHNYPLMQTKTDIIDFISGEYHLNEGNLFKLNQDLGEDLIHDDIKTNQLKNAFDQFKNRNAIIINGSHIIPDSIHKNYSRNK